MIEFIFITLVLYQIKHFLCDYPLQTQYMLKKGADRGWINPLVLHCVVHGLGTLFILVIISVFHPITVSVFVNLVLLDFTSHFVIDRIKATYKSSVDKPSFWYALGLDQMCHHLIHILILYIVFI